MTKTQSQKLEVPFHRLTEAEIRQWYKDKLLTTAGYLLAIKRVTRPPGSKFVIPNVLAFCQEWGISKSAFYRAVDELKQKGYQEWEATHGIVLKDSKKVISFPLDKKCPTDGTGIPQAEQDSHEWDAQSHERDMNSHRRDAQSHKRENQSHKPSSNKDSSSPQTNKTYTDFIQTLSDSERENFEKFVRDEWKKLTAKNGEPGEEIISLERFLAREEDIRDWHQRFLKSPAGKAAKKQAIAQQYDWRSDPRFEEWIWAAFNRGSEWIHENEALREQRKTFYDWAFEVDAFEVCATAIYGDEGSKNL
ncbi:hypothetical protein [Chroococcidiopsis sp.]|uniref:hypothetical protein n=1 Tax=Chroococcidiopsis sp. TaxID=3088168 RepID=UPI003F3A852B